MDQSIIAILNSGGGNIGILALVVLKIYEMWAKTRQKDQTSEIQNLKDEVKSLTQKQDQNLIKIQDLETKVFELERENSALIGLLGSQEQKEALVDQLIKKKHITKIRSKAD